MKGKAWTVAEIEMLKSGEFPPERTKYSCYLMRKKLGITKRQVDWIEAEMDMLRQHIIPEGRNIWACRSQAKRHNIPFHPIGHQRTNTEQTVLMNGLPVKYVKPMSMTTSKELARKKQDEIFAWQRQQMLQGLKDKLRQQGQQK